MQDVAPFLTAVNDLDSRDREPFVKDVERVGREPARILAAGISLVRLKSSDQQQLAFGCVNRCVDGVVRKMPAAVISR